MPAAQAAMMRAALERCVAKRAGVQMTERMQDSARRAQLADSVRRAAQRGGELTKQLLTVARRLSVGDSGVGMGTETLARVFEPFFTTKGVGKGTGLGLAQVYGFAMHSGGSVRLKSEVGVGTVVSLLLPVSRETVLREPVAAVAAGTGEPLVGASVLVVEDDDEVAVLVVAMLTQLGQRPTRVVNAAGALAALSEGWAVDLLFTDVLMPGGMDGLALAREAGRRRPGLPVLLTTVYTGGGEAAVPLGLPVLRKPYRADELAAALQNVLAFQAVG